MNIDARIPRDLLTDPRYAKLGPKYLGVWTYLLHWTVKQVNDGEFDGDVALAMVPFLDSEALAAIVKVGLADDLGAGRYRLDMKWQTSRDDLQKQAEKRQQTAERVRKHRAAKEEQKPRDAGPWGTSTADDDECPF